MKRFYDDKSITHNNLQHIVLQYNCMSCDFCQVHGSVPHSSTLPPSTLQNKQKENKKTLMGLFQIPNCVNPVVWVHEEVLGRRIVFGGLAPVQVVFI